MTFHKQEQQQAEELSLAIDALNHGEKVQVLPELEELVAVAGLVKKSGAVDRKASKMIASTVDILSAELLRRRRKRRWAWSFSGIAGMIAAGWLIITLNANFLIPTDPNRTYPQNSTIDLAQIVQIEREQEPLSAGMKNKLPDKSAGVKDEKPRAATEAGAEKRQAAIFNPGANGKAQQEISVLTEQAATAAGSESQKPTEGKLLVLAGESATKTTIDKVTGEIRQVYRTAYGEEVTLVQGRKTKALEAAAAASNNPKIRRTAIATDKQDGDQKEATPPNGQKADALNRVTVLIDGEEATLEGNIPAEELKKIAATIVKQ